MGFVKTDAEVREIQGLLSHSRFTTQSLSMEFLSERRFVRSVLPPCFEPADEPRAWANVSVWQSDVCGECHCGIIYLECKYKGYVGVYALWLVVSGDMPVTIGRELWGEGKKTGNGQLYFDGNEVYGFGERNGIRHIEIEADLGANEGPTTAEWYDFELKTQPHVSGIGFQHGVTLVCLNSVDDIRVKRTGTGTLKLRGSSFDPLETIPVISPGPVIYTEGGSCPTVAFAEELPDGQAYLPYIYGQKYDDFRLFHRAKRYG